MLRLNLIGAGQVGTVLAYLLTRYADCQVACILSRTQRNANRAYDLIGQGKPITDYQDLLPADCYLITVPDQHIETCLEKLLKTKLLRKNNLLFHCSGFMTHAVLKAAKPRGALIASMHPIKSFVDPTRSINTFIGTFCAIEGDPSACELLTTLVGKIGGVPFPIQTAEKAIYHASFVIASNYLVALHEMALRGLEKAGISFDFSQKILGPLMRYTLEQSLLSGPAEALSGPIVRGDYAVVEAELNALNQWDPKIGSLYRQLGEIALSLAEKKELAPEDLKKLKTILSRLS